MKTLATLLALLMLSPVFAQSSPMTMEEARKRLPQFAHLPDDSFVNVVHKLYYPHIDRTEFNKFIGYVPAPLPEKRKLGPIDQWRYDSCRTDAAKAPTPQGVNAGLLVCREKFGQ